MLVQMQTLPVRIFHWILAVCVMVLLTTGFYLDAPYAFLQVAMRDMRLIHTCFGWLLTMNFIGQVYYYAVAGRFTEVLFLPKDFGNVLSFFRYVLFITATHPNYGRYNPGQKALFSSWGLAVLISGGSGAILLFPDETQLLQKWFGGLNDVRIAHFMTAIYFMISVPLHIYLAFTENPARLQAMFTGYIKKEPGLSEDKHV